MLYNMFFKFHEFFHRYSTAFPIFVPTNHQKSIHKQEYEDKRNPENHVSGGTDDRCMDK